MNLCPICQWPVDRFLKVCDIGRPLADEYRSMICEACIAEAETGSRDTGASKYKAKTVDKTAIVRRKQNKRRAA